MRSTIVALQAGVCAVALAASPAHAEASAREFMKLLDAHNTIATDVLNAYATGLTWANSEAKARNGVGLYCQPESLAITPDQNVDIMRRFLKERPDAAEYPAGLVLMRAYTTTFPCEASGK